MKFYYILLKQLFLRQYWHCVLLSVAEIGITVWSYKKKLQCDNESEALQISQQVSMMLGSCVGECVLGYLWPSF